MPCAVSCTRRRAHLRCFASQGYRLAVQHALDVVRQLALGIEDAAAYKSDGPAASASAAAPAPQAATAPAAASGAGSSVVAAGKSTGARRALLEKCAKTALNSKLISRYQDFFAPMIVDAIECLGEDLDLSMIGIKKVAGGSVTDSFLVDGVAFRRTFSYAGFEQQPKRFAEPKILLLNLELELKSERENAEVRIEDPTKYQSIVDAEWEIIYDKLRKCVESGANVILSKQPIGDLATQYFADRDVFCAGRVPHGDMQRIAKATGARVQTTVRGLADDAWVLGKCEVFEEKQVGAERYNIFRGCPEAMTATMVLRGGAEQFIAESARSVHDALMITKNCVRSSKIVGGGGAIEMEVSRRLRDMALSIEGKLQLVVLAFARALEVIPRQISGNAGFDATDILNQLRHSHAGHAGPMPGAAASGSDARFSAAPALVEAAAAGRMTTMPSATASTAGGSGASESKESEEERAISKGGAQGSSKPSSMVWAGVDINLEGVCDTVESGVWEPAASKVSSFQAACEAACLVLSIDETVRNPRSEGAPQMGGPGMGGGAGIGRGKPMSAAMGGAGMRGMMGGAGGRGIRAFQGKGGK